MGERERERERDLSTAEDSKFLRHRVDTLLPLPLQLHMGSDSDIRCRSSSNPLCRFCILKVTTSRSGVGSHIEAITTSWNDIFCRQLDTRISDCRGAFTTYNMYAPSQALKPPSQRISDSCCPVNRSNLHKLSDVSWIRNRTTVRKSQFWSQKEERIPLFLMFIFEHILVVISIL